ncbi:MAG: diacylglycerol kinase family protein [Flammeovirgaceae bacterium]|nr:diacylglycerol kinase family protein [Flammeovirgaceae bacterium]MDW8286686.1 diacylglycerol kinase family protein [Flammeovirgaceae bacterium]
MKFSWKSRAKSFSYAFNGLKILILYEHNARIHAFMATLAIIFGIMLDIEKNEWLAIIIVVGMVFCAELLNTALERLCDKLSKEPDEKIKAIKDLGAAAVLTCSLAALLVGIVVFLPKILVF